MQKKKKKKSGHETTQKVGSGHTNAMLLPEMLQGCRERLWLSKHRVAVGVGTGTRYFLCVCGEGQGT